MKIEQFVTQLLEHTGVEFVSIETEESDQELLVKIIVSDEDAGFIIGKQAETLLAIQRIVRVVHSADLDPQKRLVIDINGYRQQKREKALVVLAETAEKVLKNGEPCVIPLPLSSAERFYIHTTIAQTPEYAQLESYSTGEGRFRRVVVAMRAPHDAASTDN